MTSTMQAGPPQASGHRKLAKRPGSLLGSATPTQFVGEHGLRRIIVIGARLGMEPVGDLHPPLRPERIENFGRKID